MQLSGKTAFITGATAGFGLACAKRMAAEGARVVACGRREARLRELQGELGGAMHALALDVRDRQAVTQALATLPQGWDKPDILVNNAGLALGLCSFEDAEYADLQQMVETNIMGVIHCTSALLPGMVARGGGHIVNISSVAGSYPYPGGHVYGGTKAFVTQFSLNLRADLVGKNIRVTSIEPGMAETEFSVVRFHGDQTKADNVYEGVTPLSADDIAESVLWAVTRPAHVNVNRVEIMPTQQACAGFTVSRKKSLETIS